LGALAAAAGAVVAVGLLMLMLVVVEVRPAEAVRPGIPGEIAYTGRLVGQDLEIFTINPGGGETFQVTHNNNEYDAYPAYSSDGTKIAYVSLDEHGFDLEIYTIDATGGGDEDRVQVTDNDRNDWDPSYSPNGKRIAYCSQHILPIEPTGAVNWAIHTTSTGGGRDVRVTEANVEACHPSYSPDGKRIAYSDGEEIYTINASGEGGKVRITNNDRWDYDPSYSPDGERIAYAGFGGLFSQPSRGDIYTISASGEDEVQVTEDNTDDSTPSYSPDGTKIAYTGRDGTDYEIYTIDADGRGVRFNVTDNGTFDYYPSWRRHP
jgi:TolB protein